MAVVYVIAAVLLTVVAAVDVDNYQCPSGSSFTIGDDLFTAVKIAADGTETAIPALIDHSGPVYVACPDMKLDTVAIRLSSAKTVTAIAFKSMLALSYKITTNSGTYAKKALPVAIAGSAWDGVEVVKDAQGVTEIKIIPKYDDSFEAAMKKIVICVE